MGFTSAKDVLRAASLELRLPASALAIPEVSAMLATRGSSWRANTPKLPAGGASGVARVDLGRVEWVWEDSEETGYDAGGDRVDYTLREDLTLDNESVSILADRQRRVCSTLRALSIPHDTVFVDGENPGETRLCGRLAGADPRAPCMEHGTDPASAPTADGILDQARACQTIEEFQALRDWIAEKTEMPGSLDADAERFDLLAADPAWRAFLGASAGLIAWEPKRVGFTAPDWKLDWNNKAPAWIHVRWEGEDPFSRLERLGAASELSERQLKLATLASLAQEPPEMELAGRALGAFCAKSARTATARAGGVFRGVSWDDAAFVAETLGAHPELAGSLSERALAFFELDLAPVARGVAGKNFAQAEAHWLFAQAAVARPTPAPPSRPRLAL